MKKLAMIAVFATLASTQHAWTKPPTQELTDLPDVLLAADPDTASPTWLAASSISDLAGASVELQERIEWTIRRNKTLRRSPGDSCLSFRPSIYDHRSSSPQDFAETVDKALGVYAGRVVELVPGFYGGFDAGTIVRLEVLEELRSSDQIIHNGVLNVFLRAGKFRAFGLDFCVEENFPAVPAIGAEILVTPLRAPSDVERSILYPTLNEYWYEIDGNLVTTDISRAPSVRSLSLAETRKMAAERVAVQQVVE